MGFSAHWGLIAFGLVVGWACVLVGTSASRIRAGIFAVVVLASAVALAYFLFGTPEVVQIGIGYFTGLFLHYMMRAALRRRAQLKSPTG